MRCRVWILLLAAVAEVTMAAEFPPPVAPGQPFTAAERSGYLSTSRYDEVMAFIHDLQTIDAGIRVENFGTTVEGRSLPLVICGRRGVVDPATARATKLPVVFIMANIHAGEVEGKEAALMLLRDLVTTHRKVRDSMTLIVAPIYNADGNEPISTSHRTTQNGPLNGVGQRENAAHLDLNRDFMKLESPEARGLVGNILQRWDPLVTIDLHTTNGSYHGYALTYSPPLNPDAPAEIIDFERDTLLPSIQKQMEQDYRQKTYYYGNFVDQLEPEKGWYTFDSRPRFGNNYIGLRNRFAILSEAYSYIDFQSRIRVTYQFLHCILESVEKNSRKMARIAAAADERIRRGKVRSLGVRFEIRPWKEKVEILWEKSVEAPAGEGAPDPETGHGMIKRSGEIVPTRMTDYGIFATVEKSDVPYAYLIDGRATAAVATLLRHGIVVERLRIPTTVKVESFIIGEVRESEKSFQGHLERTLSGKWKSRMEEIEPGTYVVRMDQSLGRVAFYLLDPRTDDGLFNWNYFDALLETGAAAPVRRLRSLTPLVGIIVERAVSEP
jgi:hypothetical protein